MRAAQPVPLPLLAALAALAVAATLFAIYVYPAYAQEGSAPDKPTGLDATASHGQVVLTWDDPQDDSITGYVILRRVRVNDQGGDFSVLVANTGSAATTYTDNEVAASTTYTYRIKAINEHGTSERSRWSHIDTPAPPVPDKPKGLNATASQGQVVLTWNDPQDDSITGYVILRRVRVNDTGGDFSVLVANTGSAATTYTDNTVAASTTYTYRIKAINEHGVSERSRWYHIDTPAAPEPAANSPATGAPAIAGAAQVGETLRVDTSGIADEDGLENAAFSYQWLADGTAISGATANAYTPVEADEGKAITVQVNFTDDAGNDETLTSAPTAAVAAAQPTEPAANSPATGTPAITGTAQVGETLTVDTSGIADEDGLEDAAFSYQWLADGTAISGATANAYTPVEADEGKAITVRVNFTDGAGNDETLTSAPTAAVAAAQPTEPPAQPTDLSATATHNQVVLTWNDPQNDSITGYVILRRDRDTDAEGHFDELVANTGSAATTYTDDTVSAETRYTYRIKAINQYGASERSRWYHIDTQAPPDAEPGPADQAPVNLSAELADGQVMLSWDEPAEDADAVTGYQVLRAEGQGGLSTLVSDTGSTATTYTDAKVAAGFSYVYRVKAIRDGERSGASNEARVQRVQLRPAKPTGLTAPAVAYNTVTLTWDAPNDDGVTGYAVVRWILGYSSSGFVTIAANTGTADPSYTDETVEAENEYLYHIKAINGQGESKKSEWLRVKTPEAPDPALLAPANLTVELVDGRVSLGWDAPAEDAGSVTGYEILRARGWDDPVVLAADTGSAAVAYIDETADAPGESYAYRVKAVRDGERSQASDPVVIQLPGPPPSAPAGLIASFGVGGVFLSWQAPMEDAGTVTGYEVLRAQGEGELTTLVADTGNAATTYTDASASGASERYAYRVRAIRGGERNADSSEARVQLPPSAPRRVNSAAASDLVLLSWADPQDDSVTGYRILRRGIADQAEDFLTLAEDTGTAETSYADDTVENDRVYVYRVLAIGPGGVSEPSQEVRVRTTVPVPPPDRPRGLPSQGTPQVRQSVSEPSGDDFTADGSTQGRLEVDGSVTGNIDRNDDRDAFVVELAQGSLYRFDLEGSETSQGTLADPGIIGIYSDNNRFPNSFDIYDGEGLNARKTFALPSGYNSGTYYIVVGEGSAGATGTYRLSMKLLHRFDIPVSEPDGDDLPADATTTGFLSVGESVTGNIDSNGDQDAFLVWLEQDRTYRFNLEGSETEQGTLADPKIFNISTLRNDGSIKDILNSTDTDSGEGENARLTFPLPDDSGSDAYYIVVGEDGGNATGTYRLSMKEAAGSGYGRIMPLEGHLRVGGTLSGTLDVPTNYGTNSYYFALEDLEVGRYTVDFGTGTIDSIHATLRRDGKDDTMIIRAQPDPTGRKGIDSHSFDVRPGMDGTHYVLLEMRRGASGDYIATLEKVTPSLEVGGSVRGDLPSITDDPTLNYYGFVGYMEFFSVDLEAEQKYQVDIEGKDTCNTCTMDYTMLGNIQAPDGDYVGGDGNFDDSDDDIGGTVLHFYGGGEGRNTRFVFTADQDGTHFLKVGGRLFTVFNDRGEAIASRFRSGTFKVSIEEED